jgi:hypothetical protein
LASVLWGAWLAAYGGETTSGASKCSLNTWGVVGDGVVGRVVGCISWLD